MIECNKKLKKNILFLTMMIGIIHCATPLASPEQKAEEFALNNVCPKYGFFTDEDVENLISSRSSAFYLVNQPGVDIGITNSLVAIKTFDGKVKHVNTKSLVNAKYIRDKYSFSSYLLDLKTICGSDAKPIEKTNFEIKKEKIDEFNSKIIEIKSLSKWVKEFKNSVEYDLEEKGKDLNFAYFNSKENDILNNWNYSSDPTIEIEDRKKWKKIRSFNNIYISRDSSVHELRNYTKRQYDTEKMVYLFSFKEDSQLGYGVLHGITGGLYPINYESDDIIIPMSPEIADMLYGKHASYDLEVIFSRYITYTPISYFAIEDIRGIMYLEEEKFLKNKYLFNNSKKFDSRIKTIKLKPLYFIFSIPSENIIITNVK